MSLNERVIGFDLRVDGERPDPDWTAARRRDFLLRLDAERPLSVDPSVWPRASGEMSRGAGLLLQEPAEDDGAAWAIAITLEVATMTAAEQERWEAMYQPAEPVAVDERWLRLGFDVADESMLSGLSNCGYDAPDVDAWRVRWAPHLNRFHLFDEPRMAASFRLASDDRVPEHAPFFVFGLYRLRASRERKDEKSILTP